MYKNGCTGEPWQDLGNAIILQAVIDYRAAKRKLKKNPFDRKALDLESEVLGFFRSDLYREITTIDADMLIKRLDEEDA